jgi:beta-mannosidase
MTKMALIPHTSVSLTTGWMFRQGDRSSVSPYLPACNAPTEIHRDLLKNKKLANPFDDLNELAARWVGNVTWTYRTTFAAPLHSRKANVVTKLRFEGLDTFASVFLNGELVLVSDNMFIEHQITVSDKLEVDGNILEIVFDSARKKGLELVEQHQEHRFIVHQTEISRGPVRKAPYHWGLGLGSYPHDMWTLEAGVDPDVGLPTYSSRSAVRTVARLEVGRREDER